MARSHSDSLIHFGIDPIRLREKKGALNANTITASSINQPFYIAVGNNIDEEIVNINKCSSKNIYKFVIPDKKILGINFQRIFQLLFYFLYNVRLKCLTTISKA